MANKRISFNQKHEVQQTATDNDDLFRKTADNTNGTNEYSIDQQIAHSLKKRQTYYLDDDIIEAIREMAHQTRKDKSELVRELLRSSALSEYITPNIDK